ncbi:MAG: hypothetical protein Q9195_004150 [Heterodermia aff. obscurata]
MNVCSSSYLALIWHVPHELITTFNHASHYASKSDVDDNTFDSFFDNPVIDPEDAASDHASQTDSEKPKNTEELNPNNPRDDPSYLTLARAALNAADRHIVNDTM